MGIRGQERLLFELRLQVLTCEIRRASATSSRRPTAAIRRRHCSGHLLGLCGIYGVGDGEHGQRRRVVAHAAHEQLGRRRSRARACDVGDHDDRDDAAVRSAVAVAPCQNRIATAQSWSRVCRNQCASARLR